MAFFIRKYKYKNHKFVVEPLKLRIRCIGFKNNTFEVPPFSEHDFKLKSEANSIGRFPCIIV